MGAKDIALPKSRAGKWANKDASLVIDIQEYIDSMF